MRYGIISDIHGNLPALESVLAALKSQKIDFYLCLGDVVGYGASPEECVMSVEQNAQVCLSGNHEWAVLNKLDTAVFNDDAREAVDWTRTRLSAQAKERIAQWPLTYKNDELMAVHGTLQNPEQFMYLMYTGQARDFFALMDRPICFVGHTHVPVVISESHGQVAALPSGEYEIDPQNRYIVNVGSVGQPRDGNPLPAFCVYDSQTKHVGIHRVAYDIAQAQRQIDEAGLPGFLSRRLALGQ